MRARPVSRFAASIIYTALVLLAASCFAVGDAPSDGADEAQVVLEDNDSSSGSPGADAPLAGPGPEPLNAEPACDLAECCPAGTTPVLGTENADVFTTSTQGRCHVTLGGNDVVNNTSAAGLHAALGGPGSDTLYGGFGPAILAGGADNDTLNGRNAADELYGQGENDSLNGGGGNDKGFGGDGNDSVNLGEGNNEADGGDGADTLNTGSGADVLRGGPGTDVLNAGGGADDLRGNSGDDTLNGQGGNDVLVGGPGQDIVNAGSGDDLVIVYDVCELVAGEVYNGEGGTDTLQIPLTLAEVQALGVVVTGFEMIQVVPGPGASECGDCACHLEGPDVVCCSGNGSCISEGASAGTCDCEPGFAGTACDTGFPFIGEGIREPYIEMSWPTLPLPSSTSSTMTAVVPLDLHNRHESALQATITLKLSISGTVLERVLPPVQVGAGSTATLDVDLNAFIPTGVDPGSVPAVLLEIPVSASLRVQAEVFGGAGALLETPSAPIIWGHIEDGNTTILYREHAHRNVFYGGDLRRYRKSPAGGAPSSFLAVTEAR